MELKYFKTDRNGTKYFYDYTCSRCGGAGHSSKWYRTGGTCYECGGSGLRHTPKIVKEYTPEYAAKLAERRKAKQSANALTEKELAEIMRRNKEAKARQRVSLFAEYGCDENGHGFAYIGNTYKYKEALREAGGKWLSWAQLWVSPAKIEADASVKVIEIDISDKINFETQERGKVIELLTYIA